MTSIDEPSRKDVRALFAPDMSGVKAALAFVNRELKIGGLSREDIQALEGVRKNALAVQAVIKDEKAQANHNELLAELRRTQDMLRSQGTGGTSFDESLSLPRRGIDADPTH